MNADQARALAEPFPKEAIGRRPQAGIMLDYVGHAATTKRLLSVDPDWTWEPLALSADGLPVFDVNGGLWIRLSVCGVSRLGYGDSSGKKGPNAVKEAIGDAIRNAAMRFGVALDLWAKEDLSSIAVETSGSGMRLEPEPTVATVRAVATSTEGPGEVGASSGEVAASPPPAAGAEHLAKAEQQALAKALGGNVAALRIARERFGDRIRGLSDLTRDMALVLVDAEVAK